jgi:hypothetical protein
MSSGSLFPHRANIRPVFLPVTRAASDVMLKWMDVSKPTDLCRLTDGLMIERVRDWKQFGRLRKKQTFR